MKQWSVHSLPLNNGNVQLFFGPAKFLTKKKNRSAHKVPNGNQLNDISYVKKTTLSIYAPSHLFSYRTPLYADYLQYSNSNGRNGA